MKDNNNIDELFTKGLKQEFPYDEALWAKVEGSLPSSPLKKSFWNFNLNSVLLAIVLLSYAFMQSDTAMTTEANTQNFELKPINKVASINASNNLKSTALENKSKNKFASLIKTKESNKIDSKNVEVNEQNRTTNSKVIQNVQLAINNNNEAHLFTISDNKQTVKENSSPKTALIIENPSLKETSTLKTQADGFAVNDNSTNESEEEINENVLTPADESILDFELISSAPFILNYDALVAEPIKEITPKTLPKKRQYYIEILAARSFNLDKSTMSTSKDFEDFKEKSETPLHSTNIGFNFLTNYRVLTFGVGIHINKFYEDVDYAIKNPSNDRFQAKNEFGRIRVPLSISYEKSFGSISTGIGTSFVLNHLYQRDGFYINEELNSVYGLNEGEESYLLIFGHQLSASVGYSLNEYMAIGAKLYYEYDLDSYTKDFDSKFQSQNLGIWVRIRPK